MYPFRPLLLLFPITNIRSTLFSTANPTIPNITIPNPNTNLSNSLSIAFTAAKPIPIPPNPHINTSTYLHHSTITIDCFTQPAPPAYPLRRPVVIADYCTALQQIILRPDFLDTNVWELSPDPPTWLGWKSHNSGIFLGGHVVTVEAFAPAFVVHVAAVIAAECLDVTKGYLGGVANAGAEGNVLVAVGALDYRPPANVAVER